MIGFKEYILIEKAEIMQAGGPPFPVSTARNVNIAKIELVKAIEDANDGKYNTTHEDAFEELKRMRGIYNIKNGEVSVWYAFDALHNSVIAKKRLRDKAIHLIIRKGEISAPIEGDIRTKMRVNPGTSEKWYNDIKKWGGKVAKVNKKDFELV